MNSVTVRFAIDARSQEQLVGVLYAALQKMKAESFISEAEVTAVHPGAEDERRRTLFVVQFNGLAAKVAELLGRIPGVVRAHVASERKLAAG
ncbi:MAG TPA: hypothetical protein VGC79_00565 [Polyangiaceae bacterium]